MVHAFANTCIWYIRQNSVLCVHKAVSLDISVESATRLEPKTSLLQRVSFRIEATGNALKNRWKLLGELVPNGIVPFFTDEAK